MNASLTRRQLLMGSLVALGGCATRDYGGKTPSRTGYSRENIASAKPPAPPAGRIQEPLPLPEPEVELPPPTPGQYVIVPRSAWTRQPVGRNNYAMNGVSRITVHHTGEHEGMIGLPDIEVVRRIETYHRTGKRWPAIGYHYIIGKDGRVYEGRPVKFQGAHVLTANEHNLGISVVGDFQTRLPNSAQLGALTKFLDDQRARFQVTKKNVFGHRDLHQSICPGNALYGWLKKSYKIS